MEVEIMIEFKDSKNLYDYIIHLSTYDINKMIEKAETEEEKINQVRVRFTVVILLCTKN